MKRRVQPAYVPPGKGEVSAARSALLLCGLPDCAKRVGGSLLNHVNASTGRCDPSVDRLKSTTGLSESGVRKGLKLLKEVGLLQELQPGKGTWSTCYQLNWSAFRSESLAWDAAYLGRHARSTLDQARDGKCAANGSEPRNRARTLLRPWAQAVTDVAPNSHKNSIGNSDQPDHQDGFHQNDEITGSRRPLVKPTRFSSTSSRKSSSDIDPAATISADLLLTLPDVYEQIVAWVPTSVYENAINLERIRPHAGASLILKAFEDAQKGANGEGEQFEK
jgi:hypothetical protein